MEILMIDGFAYEVPEHIGHKEENLYIFGQRALNRFFSYWEQVARNTLLPEMTGGIPALMYALPHVAKFYEVDQDLLLKIWIDANAPRQPDEQEWLDIPEFLRRTR